MQNKNDWKLRTSPKKTTSLRFTPTAWAKLLFLRDMGDTEVGGFGITDKEDLLLVREIGLVEQSCSWAHVAFDDHAVADFFDEQVDARRQPEQFSRIWIHTHPGSCANPSGTDERTFSRVFGHTEWAVMFILARGGQTFARLRYNVGPGADLLIPVEVDYGQPFDGTEFERWCTEYLEKVHLPPKEPVESPAAKWPSESRLRTAHHNNGWDDGQPPADWYDDWCEYIHMNDLQKEKEELEYLYECS